MLKIALNKQFELAAGSIISLVYIILCSTAKSKNLNVSAWPLQMMSLFMVLGNTTILDFNKKTHTIWNS